MTFKTVLLSLTFRDVSSQSGVQSHHFLPVTAFKVFFLSLAFRANIFLQFGRSEPPFSFIGIQNHLFQFQAFKVISFISFRRSKPSSYSLSLVFKAIDQVGLQSHHIFILAFKVIVHSLVFRAMFLVRRSDSCLQYRRSKPSLPVLGIQSHSLLPFRHHPHHNHHFLLQVFRIVGLQNHFSHWRSKPKF